MAEDILGISSGGVSSPGSVAVESINEAADPGITMDGAYHLAATPDSVTVTTTKTNQPVRVMFEALWDPNHSSHTAAIFIDAVQLQTLVLGANAAPQAAVTPTVQGAKTGLHTAGDGLYAQSGIASHTFPPASGTPYVMQRDTAQAFIPEPVVIRGLAVGTHTIDIRYKGTAGALHPQYRLLMAEVL